MKNTNNRFGINKKEIIAMSILLFALLFLQNISVLRFLFAYELVILVIWCIVLHVFTISFRINFIVGAILFLYCYLLMSINKPSYTSMVSGYMYLFIITGIVTELIGLRNRS